MCLTCSALSWRGLCARLKRVFRTNRDNSAVRSKHLFYVRADSLYRSSQDGESDSSFLFARLFLFFFYLSTIFFLFYIHISCFFLCSLNQFNFLSYITILLLNIILLTLAFFLFQYL